MSSNISSTQQSNNKSIHSLDTSSASTFRQLEQIPLIFETQQEVSNFQQKIANPSCFQKHKLSSVDLTSGQVRETKLQQYNSYVQELQDLLNQERLYLNQPAVEQMAIRIFKKQIKSKLEVQFINKLLQNMQIFEQNTDIMNSEIVARDLVKYFQLQCYKKHHKLFDVDQYGDKFYIILSGSVYCLTPDPEKSKTLQKLANNNTNDIESILRGKNQTIVNIVKAQSERKRRNSGTISAMNSIIDLDSSRFENKDESEKQFIEQQYPQFQMAKIMHQGEAFGEIALLSEQNKRTATVVFKEDSWVLSLSRASFDQIMGNYKRCLIDDNLQFLKSFEFFKNIPEMRLLGLLHSMNTHSYNTKTVIFTEKDPSSHIFFLKNGNVEISQLQNVFEQGVSTSLQNQLNQKLRIRRKAISQSSHTGIFAIDENLRARNNNNNNNTSIKVLNTECSDSDALNTSLNNSLKEKERQINFFVTKEKNKSQKKIAIASLGKGSYFGEDEIFIHANPKRKSQAVCQSGKTEIFSIEIKKLLDILKEYDQKERFIEDTRVRNQMRENRINKMLENERESKLYSTSQKYYQKNYDQMEQEKLMNIPTKTENYLQFSSKNTQSQSISSSSSISQIPKCTLQVASGNNISGNQFNNTSSLSTTYHPYRRPTMNFILDEVEKSEDFQKIYLKKKKIMEAKNNTKLFTMKKDQYVFTINKILKEANLNSKNGSLPHLQEKFSFQQTDHTKKSGLMNKYNVPQSSYKENQNILLMSECTSPHSSSRYLTPYQNNKSSSVHISYASPQNNLFLTKQKIDSSTIFNSLLRNKQQKFEEQLLKAQTTAKKNDNNNHENKQFHQPENLKSGENGILKLKIATKSVYNFSTKAMIPLQQSQAKFQNS